VTGSPLAGLHVEVLRIGSGPDAVVEQLCRLGADARSLEVGSVDDVPDGDLLRRVRRLDRFEWVVVTSKNAARRLALWAEGWPSTVRIGVVGPATADAVESLGLSVSATASEGTAASLADEIDGGPVLFFAAANARPDLPDRLFTRNIEVDVVTTYALHPRPISPDDAARLAAADVLVAMSPSAVESIYRVAEPHRARIIAVPLVAIGPTTDAYARSFGWPVASVAQGRDADAVADAIGVALSR
jgi:uroporphyrinogen-III synthase/uroporphyrinogen III methyltransferase/synthase